MLDNRIRFADRYESDEYGTKTLYFDAPKELLGERLAEYPDAECATISVEFPAEHPEAEYATVMISPTVWDEEENAFVDVDWNNLDLPYEDIEELIALPEQWFSKLSEIDRDCVEHYEFLLGRPLESHKEYIEIDSLVDEMVLEWETPEEFFEAYPEVERYKKAPSLDEKISDAKGVASFEATQTNRRTDEQTNRIEPELNLN